MKKKATKEAPSIPPTKQGWKIFFRIVLISVWVVASIIAAQFMVGFLMMLLLGENTFSKPVPTAVYSALSYILALVLIVLPMGKILKENHKDERNMLGLSGWPTWTDVGLAPVGFFAYMLLAGGLLTLFSLFPWFNTEEVQEIGFSVYSTGIDRAIAFITLVIVAPIAEEIIFRGWLYGRLRKMLSKEVSNHVSMIISILLVSVLFGLVHMQWNVGVNVFAMSIVLCGLREITGTIYAGILLHMLKNMVAFYCLFILGIS